MRFAVPTAFVIALSACVAPTKNVDMNMEGDMLGSAQTAAAQRIQVPAGFGPGTIAYDSQNCAFLKATNASGQIFTQPLRNDAGARICVN